MINHFAKTFIQSSLRVKNCFRFSQKDLVHLHKAILATRVIKKIKQSSENLEIKKQDLSLKCQVIKEIEDYPEQTSISLDESQKNPEKMAKQCMLYYFIPSNIRKNEIDSFGNINQDGNYQEFNYPDKYDNFLSLFTKKYARKFCPTSTVTGMIFKNIIDSSDYCLLIGQRLTGKTYSLILYRLLSEIIFQYKHKNYQNHPLSLASQIDFTIPKAIYLNEKLHNIEEFIEKQCYELQEFKQDLKLFQSLGEQSLQKIYSERFNIKLALLVDQFDNFAEAQRFKAYLAKYPVTQKSAEKSASLRQTYQQRIFSKQLISQITYHYPNTLQHKIQLHDQAIECFRSLISGNHFEKVMLWSAENIEQKVFESISLPQKLRQSKMQWIKMPYFEFILTETSINDITEMILHQMEKIYVQRSMNKLACDPEHCKSLFNYLRSFCLQYIKKERCVLIELVKWTCGFFRIFKMIRMKFNKFKFNQMIKSFYPSIRGYSLISS